MKAQRIGARVLRISQLFARAAKGIKVILCYRARAGCLWIVTSRRRPTGIPSK
jgi:hypothetical protein